MSITLSPSKSAYLARVTEGLHDLPAEEREEMLQDLEAHLAELEDEEVDQALGTPEAFVEEFRVSAGLDVATTTARPGLVERWRTALDLRSAWLSALVDWPRIRPVWVWTRGWLVVSAWSFLYDYEGFERFPIPSIDASTAVGLAFVILATWLSLWVDKGQQGLRAFSSVAFSVVAGFALLGMLLNPMPTYSQLVEVYEQPAFVEQLTTRDGNPITNLYAYDMDGNPLDVLLFDQAGRPLLTFPSYVYEEAEIPGNEAAHWDGGTVTFPRDQFGRIIPNLYPLELAVHDDYGELVPMAPPSLGLPTADPVGDQSDAETVPTTIITGR
jgi:hypothetical protein